MSKQYDVVVIGGGAIGLACAYFLNRAGRKVCVLERSEPGAGASGGNSGLITPSHALPLCRPGALSQAAKSMFDQKAPLALRPSALPGMAGWLWRFAQNAKSEASQRILQARVPLLHSSRILTEKLVKLENMHCEWAPTGLLSVCNTEQAFDRLQQFAAVAAQHDIETEVLDKTALHRREGALHDDLPGGVLFPGDGKLVPADFVAELARVCLDKGVVIDKQREVSALNLEQGQVHSVYTNAGLYYADNYILASGVWSATLARQFGLSLPIRPGKGYAVTTALPDPCPKRALLLEERSIAVTPWADSYRLAGTMEFAGFDDRPNKKRQDSLLEGAAEYLIEPLGRGQQHVWHGFRPMTPDDLPLLGPAPGIGNLSLACGHNMLGMSMAMGSGRLVTELIAGGKPHIDPAPFAPSRFGEMPVSPIKQAQNLLSRLRNKS